MPSFVDHFTKSTYVALAGVAVATVFITKFISTFKKKKSRAKYDALSEDKVILFQFSRAERCPNISPFCIKVETFLRQTQIPHLVIESLDLGAAPYGRFPYIVYKGKRIGESDKIISFLSKEFSVDPDKYLNESEKAVALAFSRTVNDHFSKCGGYAKWIRQEGWEVTRALLFEGMPAPLRAILPGIVRKAAIKAMKGSGIGRLPYEMVLADAEADIAAVAQQLGEKRYMMGSRMSLVDYSVFGAFAACYYLDNALDFKAVILKHPELKRYLDGIMNDLYPEFGQKFTPGKEE